MANEQAATIQPVIGSDGMLLGVTLNGITCVRPENMEWDCWAGSLLMRIVSYPRDSDSEVARALIDSDNRRLEKLHRQITGEATYGE